jgi:DNA-binding transcriptional LysR family regulator
MHLNPESLSFALLISDLGSIARAANILGMKQATLSRKLTALESRVGVRLFDRSTRGAVPTVSGAGFLNQARRIVADLQAGENWSNHPAQPSYQPQCPQDPAGKVARGLRRRYRRQGSDHTRQIEAGDQGGQQ